MAKSLDQLVKCMVGTRTANSFNPDQGIITLRDAAVDFVVGFADELVQEMVESIFTHGGGLLLVVLTRSRAVMAMIVMMVMMQMRFVLTLDTAAMHALETA